MEYLKCEWIHDDADEPILIYSEMDDERYEVRKIEFYRDGRYGYAYEDVEVGGVGVGLGEVPVPTIEEIAEDEFGHFVPMLISKDEFEEVWKDTVSNKNP
ncbi:hypothetical protein EV586_106143 [Tumebacillus sp. BK434]|uniref:DUF6881 domain-containing protein n=1 Tax=Tumebacillus sp. BK434 TaxID=2512169 RepID=UPI001051A27A|nr:hypothetical protein [Tumebacillus sp. BK434]TCP53394.1 hypothetical protein EV586_106143 [Tumebacillus sp. BK434]